MIKNKYCFQVFDKVSSKTYLETEFSNLTSNEAKSKAEDYLKTNKKIKNFHKHLDISLTLIENSIGITEDKKTYKMQWNKAAFSNGSGYYEGWYSNDSEVSTSTATSWVNTWAYPIVFLIITLICLTKTLIYANIEHTDQLKWIPLSAFLAGLFYSGAITLVRSNFNDKAKNLKDILCFNIALEVPVWIITALTVFKLWGDIKEMVPIPYGLIFTIILVLFFKIWVAVLFDHEKLKKKILTS